MNQTFKSISVCIFALVLMSGAMSAFSQEEKKKMESQSQHPVHSVVSMETSMGKIKIALFADSTPETVKNFLQYVTGQFYDGTIFHRVIPGFMIQGGGFTENMQSKKTHAPIKNEADMAKPNKKGTIAMARTNDPHSATAQFFINLKDNGFLNFSQKNTQGWGYAVFGEVIQGMEVVEKIATVKTGNNGAHRDVPVKPVVITKVTVESSGKKKP